MTMDLNVILREMRKQQITSAEIAQITKIKVKRMSDIFDGNKQMTWQELIKIQKVLNFDINQVLGIQEVDNQFMLIEDELECRVNQLTRKIPKKNKARFVQAVEYLAECFENEEKEENKDF